MLGLKKYQWLTLCAVFFGAFFYFGGSQSGKVFADCGANGVGPHGYAGAIIDVKIRKTNGTLIEAKGGVYNINTLDPTDGNYPPTSPGGNIINLNTGTRYDSANFTQIANSCSATDGSYSIVLGYGNTSQPQSGPGGSWALDCDLSRHPNETQKFRITAIQRPSNAGPGAWERSTIEIGPANGTTAVPTASLIWREDAPREELLVEIEDLTCTRVEWSVGGTAPANYRIVYSLDNDGNGVADSNTIVGPWSGGAKGSFAAAVTGATRVPLRAYAQEPNGSGGWVNIPNSLFTPWNVGAQCNPRNTPTNFINGTPQVNCSGFTVTVSDPDVSSVNISYRVYEALPGNNYDSNRPIVTGLILGQPNGVAASRNFSFQDTDNNNLGVIVVFVADDYNSSRNYLGPVSAQAGSGACYAGNCQVSVNSMSAPNPAGGTVPLGAGGVIAGQQYTISYTVNDTGQLRVPAGGLSLTEPARGAFNITTSGQTRTLTYTAPNNTAPITHAYYADWAGRFGIGPTCQVTVYPFIEFKIEPQAGTLSLLPDNERPTSVSFESSTNKTMPPGVSVPRVTAQRVVIKNSGTPVGNVTSPEYRAGDPSDLRQFTDNFSPLPLPRVLGDAYCAYITVRPAQGWITSGDRTVITVPEASDGSSKCDPTICIPNPQDIRCGSVEKVVNQPYVKVYGGDVAAGGGFVQSNGSCTVSQTSVRAYMRPLSEGLGGSGTQLGVFAWGGGQVTGFASANQRINPPAATGGNRLTFANNVAAPNNTREPLLGGQLNGTAPCLPDYFDTQYPDGSDVKINGIEGIPVDSNDDLPQNKQTIYEGADLTIAGLPNYDRRHTVYVEGDAIIRGNIIYNESGYSSAATIPNFTLVVKGNIYIDRSVNRIDGTFIAQPTAPGDTNSGRIYTCTEGDAPVQAPDRLYALCGAGGGGVDRLRVNGSLIADRVIFGRTMNTISDSVAREANDGNNKAAEIITFNPEVYLSPPVFRPKSTVTSGDYEYIATLPPVL